MHVDTLSVEEKMSKQKTQIHRIPQQLRIACSQEEYAAVDEGVKTFELKLTDTRNPIVEGDIVTIEETENGEPTGRSSTKKVSYVAKSTDILDASTEEVASRGLTVFGFVSPEHSTLRSVYSGNFTVSVGVDKSGEVSPEDQHEDREFSSLNEKEWSIVEGPAYTPSFACPQLLEDGGDLLDSVRVDKWPEGRYSVTLLVNIDLDKEEPPFQVEILDAIVLVLVDKENVPMGIQLAELEMSALLGDGECVSFDTGERVVPLGLDEVSERFAEEVPEGELAGFPDVLSEEQMRMMVQDAKERGEDVRAFEEILNGKQVPEEDIPDHVTLVTPPGKQ